MTLALSAERNGDDSSYGIDNIAVEPLLQGSVVVAGDARSAIFTPGSPLTASRRYRVEVSDVADPAGIVMTLRSCRRSRPSPRISSSRDTRRSSHREKTQEDRQLTCMNYVPISSFSVRKARRTRVNG
jgi:hypothetical protein